MSEPLGSDEFPTPVRLCCGERHAGALCNDDSVMCCLCFNKYPLSAMSETADGAKTDVCPNCATIEALQAENERLREALRAAGLAPSVVDAIAKGEPQRPCPAGHGDQCCGYPAACEALVTARTEGER